MLSVDFAKNKIGIGKIQNSHIGTPLLGSTGGDKGEVAGNSLDLGVDVGTGNLVTVTKIVYNNE